MLVRAVNMPDFEAGLAKTALPSLRAAAQGQHISTFPFSIRAGLESLRPSGRLYFRGKSHFECLPPSKQKGRVNKQQPSPPQGGTEVNNRHFPTLRHFAPRPAPLPQRHARNEGSTLAMGGAGKARCSHAAASNSRGSLVRGSGVAHGLMPCRAVLCCA